VIENIPETTLEALFDLNHLVGGLRLGLVIIRSKYIHPATTHHLDPLWAHTKALTTPLGISFAAFFFCFAASFAGFAASFAAFSALDHIALNALFLLVSGHRQIWSSGSNHFLASCEFVHSETTNSAYNTTQYLHKW
jgi:hypothetical protein